MCCTCAPDREQLKAYFNGWKREVEAVFKAAFAAALDPAEAGEFHRWWKTSEIRVKAIKCNEEKRWRKAAQLAWCGAMYSVLGYE